MLKFILGIIVGAILVPGVVVLYLVSGHAPAAVADKPLPFENWIAGTALRRRLQAQAPVRDLSQTSTADLLAGADIYKKDCVFCHGLPDQPAAVAENMFPPAPQEMQPPRRPPNANSAGRQGPPPGAGRGGPRPVGDYWRIKNGIRLTGMPSFEKLLTDDQIWQVTALLAHRRNLPQEVKDALMSQPTAAPAAAPEAPPAKASAKGKG